MPLLPRGALLAMMAAAAPLAAPVAAPLAAQVTVTCDAALNSEYQSRGLTATNRPVIQPDLLLSAPVGRAIVTAAAWASIEGGRYDNPRHHISENGGTGARVAEWNLYAEGTVAFGRVSLTPGVLSYVFPNRSGTTSESNTVELYLTAALDAPLAPTFTIWRDAHAIQGSYLEFSLGHSMGRFALGAIAGANWGQAFGDGGPMGYYVRHGITHAEFSAATSWTLRGVRMTPSAHVVFGRDPMTRLTTPERSTGAKIWFGTALGWTRTLGRRVNNPSGDGAGSAAATTQQVAVSK